MNDSQTVRLMAEAINQLPASKQKVVNRFLANGLDILRRHREREKRAKQFLTGTQW